MANHTLESLIRELHDAKREYDRLAFDEERPRTLGPPVGAIQIATLELRLGCAIPPSYLAFLELHDGWDEFSGGSKLLAVADHGCDWVKQRIAYWDALFEDDSVNPFKRGCLPVLFGEDENHFVVIDPRTVRSDGEMDFIDYDYTVEFARYPTFTHFLAHDLDVTRTLIARQVDGVPSDDEAE
jgi:hypothetical protein